MLGRLIRNRDAGLLAELARPHSGAIDHVLGLDVAEGGGDTGDRALGREHPGDRAAFDNAGAPHARTLGHRHRDVDGVDPAVVGNVEAGEQVVGLGKREEFAHLAGGNFLHVDAHEPIEGRHPPVLLKPAGVGSHLDEAHLPQAGGEAGLGLEPGVEVAGVLPQPRAGFRRRAECDHQSRGVPRGARGELVALEQHDVGPACLREVVKHRGADDSASDYDDAGTVGKRRGVHGPTLLGTTAHQRGVAPHCIGGTQARTYRVAAPQGRGDGGTQDFLRSR
ncbi:unannotated protein [freshwater metagenome]|uniref:Unannotated protein n=1 Tax=freshwater metagenome TaxID=449393 RepID=A0A6J7KWJ9_9ZZZZ